MLMPRALVLFLLLFTWSVFPRPVAAQVVTEESLCDSSIQDCRATILNLIRAETVGIDIGFWFMEDSRFSTELIRRWQAGVPVRVLIDTKANPSYPDNITHINAFKDAGIPIRKVNSRYFHWKTLIFAGQNVAQTGSGNYSPTAFTPIQPLVNFQDESVHFTNDPVVVNSFKRKFDDYWMDTSAFRNYANVPATLTRSYPLYSLDPNLNFPPHQDFGPRSVNRYNAETAATGGIDTIMYRITDGRHTDALIAAHRRGVPVRVYVEQREYRFTNRWQHSYNIDKLIAAGIPVRQRRHEGWNHQKLTLLRGQRMAIFGSQNWSFTSGQYEHNYFTTKAGIYQWFSDLFARKWNSEAETEPFVPLPPDSPLYASPATGSHVTETQVTLGWNAGFFAHKYDIYFGTTPDPPLLVSDVELGNSTSSSDYVTYTVTGLSQDVTYYWRVVSKTMANMSRGGTVWNFRTGAPPVAGAGDVVLWAARAPTVRGWTPTADTTAAGGSRLGTANNSVKVSSPLASPTSYFEMSFNADSGVPYRLWLRGKAVSNSWANDSAFVQFSDSVTSTGAATWRIGTTSATTVTIEDCTSCGLSAWGWNDNLTNDTAGALGTPVYFATAGTHTIRVQMREDGLSIDQIVLSRATFITNSPGTTKNDGTILLEQGGTAGNPPPEEEEDPQTLPSGWQSRDIGAVGVTGSASHSAGTFTVEGAGADVWGTADAFHYAYRTLAGDGTITARVAQLSGSQDWTKVGVMIRASTAANAAHAFMLVAKATKGLAFQYRQSDGASSVSVAGGTGTAPRWVRLRRAGNVITAFVSSDGVAWTTVASATFSMPANTLVGFAVSSHTTTSVAAGVFDNVAVP
jgi:HKD family nuclease/regulation of enolase protein 1 (concanavalin A-like superfamily)